MISLASKIFFLINPYGIPTKNSKKMLANKELTKVIFICVYAYHTYVCVNGSCAFLIKPTTLVRSYAPDDESASRVDVASNYYTRITTTL